MEMVILSGKGGSKIRELEESSSASIKVCVISDDILCIRLLALHLQSTCKATDVAHRGTCLVWYGHKLSSQAK